MERLRKALGYSKERYRLFAKLTKAQQQAVRDVYRDLHPREHWGNYELLGVPPPPALGRWAGIEPPTILEQSAGKWPVWKWLKAASRGEVDVNVAARAVAGVLDQKQIADLAIATCVRAADDPDYELWTRWVDTERELTEGTAGTIRALAALIDASGDDAAIQFAERVEREKQSAFYLAAVATFALAARARRKQQPFPKRVYELASKADDLAYDARLHDTIRDVFEVIPMAEREAFLEKYGMRFDILEEEEIINGRTKETPMLFFAWHVADLVPTQQVLEGLVAVAAAYERPPKQAILDVFAHVGPPVAPYLEAALKDRPRNKSLLAQALEVVRGRKPVSKAKRA